MKNEKGTSGGGSLIFVDLTGEESDMEAPAPRNSGLIPLKRSPSAEPSSEETLRRQSHRQRREGFATAAEILHGHFGSGHQIPIRRLELSELRRRRLPRGWDRFNPEARGAILAPTATRRDTPPPRPFPLASAAIPNWRLDTAAVDDADPCDGTLGQELGGGPPANSNRFGSDPMTSLGRDSLTG